MPRITIRVTEDEKEVLEAAAARRKCHTLSQWIRERMLREAGWGVNEVVLGDVDGRRGRLKKAEARRRRKVVGGRRGAESRRGVGFARVGSGGGRVPAGSGVGLSGWLSGALK